MTLVTRLRAWERGERAPHPARCADLSPQGRGEVTFEALRAPADKETSKYFGVAKLGAGPARDTVTVEIAHADKDTIDTACKKGFPKPKEIFGELGDGKAHVPQGYEKKARFVVDLTTSTAVPEAEFTRR